MDPSPVCTVKGDSNGVRFLNAILEHTYRNISSCRVKGRIRVLNQEKSRLFSRPLLDKTKCPQRKYSSAI